jgi:hypothetical protein
LFFVDHFTVDDGHEIYAVVGVFYAELLFFGFFRDNFNHFIPFVMEYLNYFILFEFKIPIGKGFGQLIGKAVHHLADGVPHQTSFTRRHLY